MTQHDADPNRAVVERMVNGMLNQDLDTVGEALAEDAVVSWPQSGETMVGRAACLMVYGNYPGGPPSYTITRIAGSGDHFSVEGIGDYSGKKVFWTSIVDLANGKIVRQTDYWADPFEAPAWRAQWVERGDQ